MKRVIALLLCLCLSATMLPTVADAVSPQADAKEDRNIAYLPLDDRPVNTDRVQYMAESIGYTIEMPVSEEDHDPLYDTKLNMPAGDTSAFGYRTGELLWLLNKKDAGYTNYIISVDQILSGGLANAREETIQYVFVYDPNQVNPDEKRFDTGGYDPDRKKPDIKMFNTGSIDIFLDKFSDWYQGSSATGTQRYTEIYAANRDFDLNGDAIITFEEFAIVQLAKLLDEENVHVTFIDTMTRAINATTDYAEYRQNEVFEGFVKNQELWKNRRNDRLGSVDAVIADEIEALNAAKLGGTDEYFIAKKIAARQRKLALTDTLLNQLNHVDSDSFEYIIGCDDAQKSGNIQVNERLYIQDKIEGKANEYCFAGADELGMTAVCRLYVERVGEEKLPDIGILYFGGGEEEYNDAFSSDSAEEGIDNHLQAMGFPDDAIKRAKGRNSAELMVLVYKPTDNTSDFKADEKHKMETINELYKKYKEMDKPAIVVNLVHTNFGCGTIDLDKIQQLLQGKESGKYYQNLMVEKFFSDENSIAYPLTNLLGYSSWGTQGNAEGIALSQGVVRWMYLKNPTMNTTGDFNFADTGYMRSLTFDFVKDYLYIGVMKMTTQAGTNSQVLASAMAKNGVNRILDKLGTEGKGKANQIISLIDGAGNSVTREVGGVSIGGYSYPWGREREIRFDIAVKLSGEAVVFNANGGNVSSEILFTGSDGKLATLPVPTRGNYTFNGWYTAAKGGDKITTDTVFPANPTEMAYAYAQWTSQGASGGGGGNGGGAGNNNGGGTSSSGSVSLPGTISGGKVTVSNTNPPVNATVTITVKPEEGNQLDTITVTDSAGHAVTVTDKGNGLYTYVQPAGGVKIDATFSWKSPFSDVTSKDWYSKNVEYVYRNGIMNGTSTSTFSPSTATNRAMIAVVLYRMEKTPSVSDLSNFPDVPAGKWYADAAAWAKEEGIVTGNALGNFVGEDTLTREQLATILYRYATAKGAVKEPATTALNGFTDSGKLHDWAKTAVAWCVENGIINGKTDKTIDPQGSVTRATMAVMINRYCDQIKDAK